MTTYRILYKEFEDHVRPHGLQPFDQIRILAKEFALQKRNFVNDIICRRYYWVYVVNYCRANTIDVPHNFWENIHDPDGEFTDDANTIRAVRRKEKIINDAVEAANRLHEERELR
jgi:hypothetical protein